jgi:hypothetical protein
MKTAIILSGQPRSYQRYADVIKRNLIDPNNADVFIHCWCDNSSLQQEIIDRYSPIDYFFEPQREFVNPGIDLEYTRQCGYAGGTELPKYADYHIKATYSMWYSIKQAFHLVPYGEYDYVIKCRFDCGLHQPVVCRNYEKAALWAEDLGRPELVNNWLNFASWEIMYDYCHIYDKIDQLYKETNIWCNEYWIKYVMDKSKTSVCHGGWGLTIENINVKEQRFQS